ncbi:MAG: hypothetical protein OEW04_09315 [Nitrospirota bacterium]|nr:hypothetical protein [Nitrospirota bacterium]
MLDFKAIKVVCFVHFNYEMNKNSAENSRMREGSVSGRCNMWQMKKSLPFAEFLCTIGKKKSFLFKKTVSNGKKEKAYI